MTLQNISLLAQIVGVLLIPASLLFVGIQMRQTHAIERGNAQRDILEQTREWWRHCVEDEETFDTFCAGMADYAGLSRYRQAKFNALGGRQWWGEASKVGNAELCGYVLARLAAEASTLPLWTDLLPFFRLPDGVPAMAKLKVELR